MGQRGPKLGQHGPKLGQHGLKLSQDGTLSNYGPPKPLNPARGDEPSQGRALRK